VRNVSSYGHSDPLTHEAVERCDPQPEIHALIGDRLERVERMFRENLASPVAIVEEIGSFVAQSGGKRVRPTAHLLAARLCRYDGPHDVLLATVLEFIHSATLIHDDIIDEARVRRGRPSVNVSWGNNVTVLFGDYLFAKAMEMALAAGSLEVMERLAEVTLRMTEGEMLQTRYAGRLDLSVGEYLDLIEKKTAALFGCCCELGGVLAGVAAERRRALRDYGVNLGLAFQLVDDLLDFTGDERTLGKPAATDLREGKATLAVIDLLERRPAEARELARAVVESEADHPPQLAALGTLLEESGALFRARQRARDYAQRACVALGAFEDGRARRAMLALPELLLRRNR
jgi:octaprenyl-diphosphate synthase